MHTLTNTKKSCSHDDKYRNTRKTKGTHPACTISDGRLRVMAGLLLVPSHACQSGGVARLKATGQGNDKFELLSA